jgi:transposase-like protein
MWDAMSGYDEEKRYAVVAEARRKWTAAERKLIVAETEASSVSCVVRTHGVATSIVYIWRREVA